MKKKIVGIFFVFCVFVSQFCFAKDTEKKFSPDIQFEVTDEDDETSATSSTTDSATVTSSTSATSSTRATDSAGESEELEEFDFPEDIHIVKNVIKADLGTSASCILFELYSLIPTNVVRLPLSWEISFVDYCTFQLEIESLSYFIMPSALGVSAGVAVYPLGKSPYDLYIALRTGGAFGLFYAFTAQASVGWQFILKSDFVISLGADFAYYFCTAQNQFYIPSVSFALGWGF